MKKQPGITEPPVTEKNLSDNQPPSNEEERRSAWSWVPSVYFIQGLQYSVIVQLFAIVFFTMGISAGDTLFWIGAVSFPWTIKPLWGPLVDKYGSKRTWTWLMQLLIGLSFAALSGALLLGKSSLFGMPIFMLACIVLLALGALFAATHDIACDGFYMLGLSERRQAFFVGIRSTCFQIAMMFANGVLIWMGGAIQSETGLTSVESTIQARESALKTNNIFEIEQWPETDQESILIMPPVLDTAVGESASITVRLSASPPVDIVRVVTLQSGGNAPSVSIPKEYTRLEFTAENWNHGVDVPVNVDSRLHGEEKEVITAQAGNIPLSWSLVMVLCAVMFLMAAGWHRFILPFPAIDSLRKDHGNRPGFLVAASWLGLTVAVPAIAIWLLSLGIGTLRDDIRSLTVGEVSDTALQDIRELMDLDTTDSTSKANALWSEIEELHREGINISATKLEATINLRQLLDKNAIDSNKAELNELVTILTKIQSDPTIYGNVELRQILNLTSTLNNGTTPQSSTKLQQILTQSMNPVFKRFANNGSAQTLAVMKSIEQVLDGQMPDTKKEFDSIIEQAKATPSKLTIKGFDSIFAVGRILLILVLIAVVVRIPVLWRPFSAMAHRASKASGIGFADVFASFFAKPGVAITLGFLLTYRLGESQLSQLKNIFFLDSQDGGGLGMSLGDVALINSTTYLMLLTAGSLLGGMLIARVGLRKMIWPMVALIHLPNLLYLWLSMTQPESLLSIHLAVGIESFGHGFGFAAYLVIMMIAAQGPYKTAHYALCTGAMALGNMIPGMWAGYLQELVGYNLFFVLVMIFSIPGTILIPFLKIEMSFGGK